MNALVALQSGVPEAAGNVAKTPIFTTYRPGPIEATPDRRFLRAAARYVQLGRAAIPALCGG
jgi:hypothetical protein